MKNKIKIISQVRINGEVYLQEELNQEEFHRLLVNRAEEVMNALGHERVKPA